MLPERRRRVLCGRDARVLSLLPEDNNGGADHAEEPIGTGAGKSAHGAGSTSQEAELVPVAASQVWPVPDECGIREPSTNRVRRMRGKAYDAAAARPYGDFC